MRPPQQEILAWLTVITTLLIDSRHAIGCFICDSLGDTNTKCHDPFHPINAKYESNCQQGKKGIEGLFPARFCVKITGWRMIDNAQLVIRRCALERYTENDHKVGQFKWDNQLYTGTIETCKTDGCNGASQLRNQITAITTLVAMATIGRFLW